jgi:phospholipase/carboxylesterase
MFQVMATNRPLRLCFEAIFICCLSAATSFGATTELGRIVIPANSSAQTASAGLQKLSGRNGLLYIPTDHAEPLPLLILLHKASGSASEWFGGSGSYAPYADKGHFIILAPESPGQSWGTGPKKWGYDYLAINRALEEAFARCAIDRSRLAIGGFSDGASYALSLGLANGDVFSYIVAFSPGFIVRAQARGRSGPKGVEVPLVYIAHGSSDNVLPIASTSRIFVSSLRKNGYNVEFREFSGGHYLSRQVADQAMSWLITAFMNAVQTQGRSTAGAANDGTLFGLAFIRSRTGMEHALRRFGRLARR